MTAGHCQTDTVTESRTNVGDSVSKALTASSTESVTDSYKTLGKILTKNLRILVRF